jgi:methionine sulfoxide reductase heme-binding subunit
MVPGRSEVAEGGEGGEGVTGARRDVRSVTRGAPPTGESAAPGTVARHRSPTRRTTPPRWLHPLVVTLGVVPFVYIAGALLSDFLQGTRYLGSNPIKEAEHMSGEMAIRFLLFTLAITPAMRMTRKGWLIRYRRTFGLFAFAYACFHLLIYAVLDVELMWSILVEDVTDRIYITLGMTAFVLLLPLAITSTKGWIRRLGSARWNVLHRAVYVAVVLAMIHYFMAVKRDITDPLILAVLFAVLFGYRLRTAWQGRSRAS